MRLFLLLTLILTALVSIPSVRGAEPDPKAITYVLPDKINWRKSATADTAQLQGDSSKPGIYIEMVRWHAGNMSRPHTHDTARYITVISGTWWVGTGDKFDPPSTKGMPAGSYVVDIPNQLHYDGAKDEDCVILIVGTGPMKTSSGSQMGGSKSK